MDKLTPLVTEEFILLLRLFLAHLIADFVLQPKNMVEKKRWNNRFMYAHLGVVAIATWLFTNSLVLTFTVVAVHGAIDSTKGILTDRYSFKKTTLLFVDQMVHFLSLVIIWMFYQNATPQLWELANLQFETLQMHLVIFGYVLVMWPTGYAIQFALRDMVNTNDPTANNIEKGGQLIGIFERIIILTFMLLSAYEAIGFLITGKSIIRFSQSEEKLRSEYVLLGTMMSYGAAILVGALINYSFR